MCQKEINQSPVAGLFFYYFSPFIYLFIFMKKYF